MVRAFLQPFTSETFRTSLVLIIIAEVVTIFFTGLLLQAGVNQWILAKTAQAIRISEEAASASDWTQVDRVPKDEDSALGERFQDKLRKFSDRYFAHDVGSVYLVTVKHGEEYDTYQGGVAMEDIGKANQSALKAYEKRKTTFTPTPVSDAEGTYLAAYTPILHDGKVVGLVAAEYDEGPMSDLLGVVWKSFWLSIVPAFAISLVVAYILAKIFVAPIDLLRTVGKTARTKLARALKGEKDELWEMLTPRELEIAELASEGLQNQEIAERLNRSSETVKSHLASISRKTGWTTRQLIVESQARLIAQALVGSH